MENILELGDSYNSKYPQHFQLFLDNCVKKFQDTFSQNDYLFAAVYFIILETGFTPLESTGIKSVHDDSVNFSLRNLRSIISYSDEQIRTSLSYSKSACHVYRISLKLGKHSSSLCELQGVPSTEVNTHLIINFLLKDPQVIKSMCLDTKTYVEKNETESEHKYLLKNLKELSLLIKNNISVHVKDLILINEEEGCSANLLCLPEEIQKKIIYFLTSDPISIQYLSASCSYFYSLISKDAKLWELICFKTYSGWVLNKALQEINTSGDANVFRTAFFKLKIKSFKGSLSVFKTQFTRRSLRSMSKSIKYIIQSSKGPKPVGPYNQAVRVNNLVYLSGVIGIDRNTNQIVPGGVEKETRQIFQNMEAVLKAAGSGFDKLVKASVFLNDINDFQKVNEIYKQYITSDHPARSAYQVANLPVGAQVEIEAIALCGEVETKYITE